MDPSARTTAAVAESAGAALADKADPAAASLPAAPLPPLLRAVRCIVEPSLLVRLLALLVSSSLVYALFYYGTQPVRGISFPAPWDKLVHYLFFGGLAGMFWVLLGGRLRTAAIGALLLTAAVGFTDEYVQSFTPGREPSVVDFAFDLLGGLTAVGVLGWWRDALRRRAG